MIAATPPRERRPRLLLVEDEYLIVSVLEDLVSRAGYEVAACAPSVADALRAVEHVPLDAALLDVNLAGERSFPIADRLVEKRIPFLFMTGYGAGALPPRYADIPTLPKPFRRDHLLAALAVILAPGLF